MKKTADEMFKELGFEKNEGKNCISYSTESDEPLCKNKLIQF
jgi:hypothetical protein